MGSWPVKSLSFSKGSYDDLEFNSIVNKPDLFGADCWVMGLWFKSFIIMCSMTML